MTDYQSNAENTARNYYNSDDADHFYHLIWGGEDLHLGIYESDNEGIFDASRRAVQYMAKKLTRLDANTKGIDIGAGFGGSARYLAHTFGCHVTCLNISEKENQRNRKMNAEQGVGHLVDVLDGSFEAIPVPDASFDVVWSQDAILHSGNRAKVMQEIARILVPGGEAVLSDPMQADDCPPEPLAPILDRLHLETLGSPRFYLQAAKECGLIQGTFENLTPHLILHYSRILEESEKHHQTLSQHVSAAYIQRMKKGLNYWIKGGKNGYLTWGMFHFRKP